MHRALIPVSDITPTTKYWTAKVLVMQKLNPQESQSGEKRYQRFILIDKDETKIQAIIYGSDIALMEKLLQLHETCFVSNARVVYVDPRFRIVSHIYQWIISRTTLVRPVTYDSLPRELGAPRFTRLVDIPPLLGSETMIDILAIVNDQTEQRPVNTSFGTSIVQGLFVINDERIPMMLSLWNEVLFSEGQVILNAPDKLPIIVAIRLRASDYNGISLTAKGFANIILNPSYPESQSLKTWRARNHAYLTEIVEEKKYLQRSTHHPVTPQEKYSSTTSILTDKVDKLYHTLFNGTTELAVVLFGNLAESFLGLTAVELIEKDKQNETVDCDAINTQLHGHQFNADIRKKKFETNYGPKYQYTILGLEKTQQLSMGSDTEASSSSYSGLGTTDVIAEPSGG